MKPLQSLHTMAGNLKRFWLNLRVHVDDAITFARSSGLLQEHQPGVLAGHVLKTAHRVDKGLSLPDSQPGHGLQAAQLLSRQLQGHLRHSGADWVWQSGRAALARRARHEAGVPASELGVAMRAREVQEAASGAFPELVRVRRSVRQFAPGPVCIESLKRACELAALSPSACNRSGGRVWIATEVEQRRRVLALQDGHQGFGEQAAAVAVVTVDTSAFHTVAERHQAWVDGGLFAMTLLYALQHEGLGTCCLNWCVQPSTDRRFKRSVGIPLHETVVMLIAIGALPDEFTVAHSPRRPLDEVMHGLGSHT